MATGSAQDEQGLPKVELQQLSREFQLVVEQGQASMMLAMRDMMAEFMRNKGRSESSSAGSSAAGREGPRGAEPSAVRTSVAAVAGDTAAGRETTLRGEASRNLGATGRREAAVPVEVGPARGQPDQPRRAGEWDAFPRGLARCGAGAAAATAAAGPPAVFTRRGAAAGPPAGLARRGAEAAAATPAAGLARRGTGAAAAATAAGSLTRRGAAAAAATAAAGPSSPPGGAQKLQRQAYQQPLPGVELQLQPAVEQQQPAVEQQQPAAEEQQQPAVEEPQPAVEQEQQAMVHEPLPPPPLVARASHRTARPRARHR